MDYPWNNPAIWHAINVHLPITLAVLGLPLLCVVAITRGRYRWLRWSTLGLYAAVTVAAWFAAHTGEGAMDALSSKLPQAAWDRVNFHEWMAQWVWVLAGLTTLLLLLAHIPPRLLTLVRIPPRAAMQTFVTLALIFSVTTVIWVMVTAHSGGLAVYEHGLGTIAMRDGAPDANNALARADADNALARAEAVRRARERAVEAVATTQATTAPVTAVTPVVSPAPATA